MCVRKEKIKKKITRSWTGMKSYFFRGRFELLFDQLVVQLDVLKYAFYEIRIFLQKKNINAPGRLVFGGCPKKFFFSMSKNMKIAKNRSRALNGLTDKAILEKNVTLTAEVLKK